MPRDKALDVVPLLKYYHRFFQTSFLWGDKTLRFIRMALAVVVRSERRSIRLRVQVDELEDRVRALELQVQLLSSDEEGRGWNA